MSLFTAFDISAGGLSVQRARLEVTSENLANANSTRTPEGGPYRKKDVIISSVPVAFESSLSGHMHSRDIQGAEVLGVVKSSQPPKRIYDPSHPDAAQDGYVAMPDINVTQELMDVLSASKAYEANITVLNASKSMVLRTLELGSV